MTGRRHDIDRSGAANEKAADLLLNGIASMVRVPREEDFGIDFYCHPRSRVGPHVMTVSGLAALQVKGEDAPLTYGGRDVKGQWRQHHFTWLMSLATPLYWVRVASDLDSCSVFSLAPLWRLFVAREPYPFEVRFTTQPAAATNDWKPIQDRSDSPGRAAGGRLRWTVDLGPPILQYSLADLSSDGFVGNAAAVLQAWVAQDRLNLMRFLQSIPIVETFNAWKTNSLDGIRVEKGQYWHSRPGANVEALCRAAEPLLVNLGIHLQWQDDPAAYALIPVLRWLDNERRLGGIGQGLLDGLGETQRRGVGPRPVQLCSDSGVEASPSPSFGPEEDSDEGE